MKKGIQRKLIAPIVVGFGIGACSYGINLYKQYKDEQLIDRIRKSEYNPQTMIKTKLEEERVQKEFDNKVNEKMKEIANYLSSDEYKLREETRHWRLPLGITVDQLQPIVMEISYYSDLAIENSKYGNVTATGKILKDGMIANNHLDFGTNVYIEGEGLKVVEDRGSYKYFSKLGACDVFVPRNAGESDRDYYKRVNNKGRHYKQSYIIHEK